jgi:protein-S-isoprenylcysteine O-methyltransferase Ste14
MLPRFRERRAREASLPWNLVKTLGQAVSFWTVFLFLIPLLLLRAQHALHLPSIRCTLCGPAGIASFILGSALALCSDYFMARYGEGTPLPFDASRRLVVEGPYAYVRNPMSISGLMQLAGIGLYVGSVLVLLCAAAGWFLWTFVVRPWEEANLADRYGEAYIRYRRRVGCWIPRLRAYR